MSTQDRNPQLIPFFVQSVNHIVQQLHNLPPVTKGRKKEKNFVFPMQFGIYKFEAKSTFPRYDKSLHCLFIKVSASGFTVTVTGDIAAGKLVFDEFLFPDNMKIQLVVSILYLCMCILCAEYSKDTIEVTISKEDKEILTMFEKLGFVMRHNSHPYILDIVLPPAIDFSLFT